MATWKEVKDFIRSKYTLQSDDGDYFSFVYKEANGRTQLVSISKKTSNAGAIWAEMLSPVGVIERDELNDAMEDLYVWMCGGLIKTGERHFVRHCACIDDMSADELVKPLGIISSAADELEQKYVGGDKQ
jgi:hypothetical protein